MISLTVLVVLLAAYGIWVTYLNDKLRSQVDKSHTYVAELLQQKPSVDCLLDVIAAWHRDDSNEPGGYERVLIVRFNSVAHLRDFRQWLLRQTREARYKKASGQLLARSKLTASS